MLQLLGQMLRDEPVHKAAYRRRDPIDCPARAHELVQEFARRLHAGFLGGEGFHPCVAGGSFNELVYGNCLTVENDRWP